MSSVSEHKAEGQALRELFNNLRGEVTALMTLSHELRDAIDAALEERRIDFLRTVPSKQLRAALIEARGPRGAAFLRTKLNGDLEARRGRRHPSNGRASVHSNGTGNGVHAE